MTAISIDIKEKRYAGHTAIADMAFDVAENEFACILGPSGCGKTTLLNLIAGIDTDYSGRISMSDGALDHLAYVFQTPRLLPWRTALQNIELVMDGDEALASDLLAAVGMEKFGGHFPGELSLGMQRRVSLARAFARRPTLMLMDEPFVSLDPDAAVELRGLLKSILRARPATVIFVTHDHREAVQLGDRVVMLTASPAKVMRQVDVTIAEKQRGSLAVVDKFIKAHLR